jgi:hypothetical protein
MPGCCGLPGDRRLPGYRRLMEGSLRLLFLIGGWVWFGASGVALVGLWIMARPADGPSDHDWEALLRSGRVRLVHVTALAVVIVTRGAPRAFFFRDELPPLEWARLRRACLNPSLLDEPVVQVGSGPAADQPATGRNTSS